MCSHTVEPFVVRGSRQAKFADEVRINELQIKTGRTALMARLNKVPSIRPRLRRDRGGLVSVTPSLTKTHLLQRLILFIETRLQTLSCPTSPPIKSRPGLANIGVNGGGEMRVASPVVPDPAVWGAERRHVVVDEKGSCSGSGDVVFSPPPP